MSDSDSTKVKASPEMPMKNITAGTYLLKPILSKMDIVSYARMIQTNSTVKNFVDEQSKPFFFVPYASYLSIDCRTTPSKIYKIYIDRRQYKTRVGEQFDHDIHNFTFEKIQIKSGSKPGFYNQALLEDLKRIGTNCRNLLFLREMDQVDLEAIVKAVNPQRVSFYLGLFDIRNPAFDGLDGVEMTINRFEDHHYFKDERIQLLFVTEHKIIIWIINAIYEKIANGFLKFWRDGKAPSRQKEIAVRPNIFDGTFPIEDKNKIIRDIQFDCSKEELEKELQKDEVVLFMTNVRGEKARIFLRAHKFIFTFNI